MSEKLPKLPSQMSEFGKICLQALSDAKLGKKISLGGALGLLHYHDYRATYDVDAWWASDSNHERQQVIKVIQRALEPLGEVKTRSWGDVVSIELQDDQRKAFSFQIADRSAQIESPGIVPGFDVLLDAFPDLVASKMVALVERGAPRDFRDIYAICQADLISPEDCWRLWGRRQELANSDDDYRRATLAMETHLERIERHRPLENISDIQERSQAKSLREWYREELLNAATQFLD